MKLAPPAPFNSIMGLAYLLLAIAAFTYAYNKNAALRKALAGPPTIAKV
jgi:hypothetical protein